MTSNFLDTYKAYASEITDAPIEFHDFLALATIGISLGNRCFFPFGDSRIYPNFWMLIIAPSSSYRKSTALNISRRLLSEHNNKLIYPSEFSHEKILEVISDNPSGAFYFSEFMSLMGLLSRDYMAGTKALLTDLYDCPSRYSRSTKGQDLVIEKPVISMITCSTVDWLLNKTKEEDIQGGFIPRFLIIPSKAKVRDLALPPPACLVKRDYLLQALKAFSMVSGCFYLDDKARKAFECWYTQASNNQGYGKFSSAIQRLQIYIIKLAMVIEVNNSGGISLKISEQSMTQAIQYANWIANQLKTLHEDEFTFSQFDKNLKKVMNELKAKASISREDMFRSTRLNKKDFDLVIQTLEERGCVTTEKQRLAGAKKPTITYSLQADKKP